MDGSGQPARPPSHESSQSPVSWSALVEAAAKSPSLPSTGAPAPASIRAELPYAAVASGPGFVPAGLSAAPAMPPPQAMWYNARAVPYGATSGFPGPVASTSQPVPPAPTLNPAPATAARKPKRRSSTKAGSSGEESEEGDAGEGAAIKKRSKISRACDGCRKRKIRCNPVPDSNPPRCIHCTQHNYSCSWYLPIAETRFFKETQKDSSRSQHSPRQPPAAAPAAVRKYSTPPVYAAPSPSEVASPQHPAQGLPSFGTMPPMMMPMPGPQPMPAASGLPYPAPQPTTPLAGPMHAITLPPVRAPPRTNEARLLGPTSMAHLLHTHGTLPVSRMAPYDEKHKYSFGVTNDSKGFIRIVPPDPNAAAHPLSRPLPAIQQIGSQLYDQLVNQYFLRHSPLMPIVSKRAFISPDVNPLLLHTVCGLSALDHRVPPHVTRTIKQNINELYRDDEIVGRSSIETVQALLLFSSAMDLEIGVAGSKMWNTAGLAIRMAQDLGLHRELATEREKQTEPEKIEDRRRLWACLMIADTWSACMFGLPAMIRVEDCDCQLPSSGPSADPSTTPRATAMFRSWFALSSNLGRILRLYSPTGTYGVTNEAVTSLVNAMVEVSMDDADAIRWHQSLPFDLRFDDVSCTLEAGCLNMLSVPVWFLLFRPFLRITYSCEQLTLALPIKYWNRMSDWATKAIEWSAIETNSWVLESIGFYLYSYFICSLVCYHRYIRQRTESNLVTLLLARDTLKRLAHDETSARKKVTEVLSLLCTTAQQVQQWAPDEPPAAAAGVNGHATTAPAMAPEPAPSQASFGPPIAPGVEPGAFLPVPDLSSLPFDMSEFGGDAAFWSALGAGAMPPDGLNAFGPPAPVEQDQFDVDAWSSFFSGAPFPTHGGGGGGAGVRRSASAS